MTLGEKLKLLLKEKNMSQEDLAEKLYVSRQAVGKWVNDKGTPDIEKVVQISNLFEVSLDYLLKDNIEEKNISNKKYYVSKEMLDNFYIYNRKNIMQITFGISLIILSNIFYSFEYQNLVMNISYWLTFITGLILILTYFFQTKQYQEIKLNNIVLDNKVFEEFKNKRESRRKKYIAIIIVGIIILLLSSEFDLQHFGNTFYNIFEWGCDAISISLLVWASMSMYADTIVIKNFKNNQNSRQRKYSWVYVALPFTIVAVVIGIFSNAWSPYAPIIILFCVLLVTTCKLILEREDKNE
ncbi:MAG: helix-turn-helix transcriptional regulator [Clostridia bacterium]|nr:helix-turn-helix transcriptional regulator [Clostridia bacterium]